MSIPTTGEKGRVTVTRISPTGNAHVELASDGYLNLGALDCDVGDEVQIERLDEKYCLCMNNCLHENQYRKRMKKMREHDKKSSLPNKKINSRNNKSQNNNNKKSNNGVGKKIRKPTRQENKNHLINGRL